ncbi:hypothetical protein D9611_014625 [Ephemerocybe angulata]|uniref:Uncharacterized protein n=1 Tax=Ephemerocybe angulata TaxID=980116 RepID=A0A8H5FIQ2_9AGAR|nr:hypothetical protein D9611_014625 [Tulosesus angulatus]
MLSGGFYIVAYACGDRDEFIGFHFQYLYFIIAFPFSDNHTNPNSTDDLPGTTHPPAPQLASSSRRPQTSTHPPSSSTSHPQHTRASSYDPFLATPAPAALSTAMARDLKPDGAEPAIAELAEEVGRQGRLLGRLVEVLGEGVLRGEGRDGLKGRGKRREGEDESWVLSGWNSGVDSDSSLEATAKYQPPRLITLPIHVYLSNIIRIGQGIHRKAV